MPQAWVIGHIHKPAVIREQSPLIFYPGIATGAEFKGAGRSRAVYFDA